MVISMIEEFLLLLSRSSPICVFHAMKLSLAVGARITETQCKYDRLSTEAKYQEKGSIFTINLSLFCIYLFLFTDTYIVKTKNAGVVNICRQASYRRCF